MMCARSRAAFLHGENLWAFSSLDWGSDQRQARDVEAG